MKSFVVDPGDIIVSCAGTIGEIYILPSNAEPGIINQALMRIRLYNKNIEEYFILYFDSVLKKEANYEGKGTAIKNIPPFEILKRMLLPLPPENEILRIINEINKINCFTDKIKTSYIELNKLKDIAKQKILDEVFGENSSYKSYYENMGIITDDVEIYDNMRKPINSDERSKRIESAKELHPYYGATGKVGMIDDYLFDGEYVLLGEDGAPFLDNTSVKAYIISGKSWVNNHAHVLRSKTNNKFLMYYLNWFNYFNYVSGTTRLKLNQAMLRKFPFPNMPPEIKEQIVQRIEKAYKILESID